jgi:hypothetical protein
MSIINYYKRIKKEEAYNPKKHIHGLDIPFRCLLLGPSGGGKTNVLLDFIHKSSGTFNRICICCKSKDEPLYNYLSQKSPEVEFYENGDIPNIDEFDKNDNNLIVFDDLVLMKDQSDIQEFMIRGRKKNISVFYLSQSYYKISKLIRINCNYIIIKKLSSLKDLKLILSEYGLDVNLNKIIDIYNDATKDFTNFMFIDINKNLFTKNWPIN